MYLKILSAKCQPFGFGLNILTNWQQEMHFTNTYLTHLGLALFFWSYKINSKICDTYLCHNGHKQRFLTPGHQGWNDLHSLCRIGMEYYLLNNDDHNIIYWIMIIIMIIMMTMMIIGTATIMIMIIIITTTLTMTIIKMIMIKTAQTPCQSLYKDRRI